MHPILFSRSIKGLLILLVLGFFAHETVLADFHVAKPFQDNMVLQRQKPVPIWGWADAGKSVTVKMGATEQSATDDPNGYWRVNLPAMEVNDQGRDVTITCDGKTITLKNVLVGEVWVCAGQSNMAMPFGQATSDFVTLAEQKKDCEYPLIRYIYFPASQSPTPLAEMDPILDAKATWEPMSANTVGKSMGIPFFFARNLYQQLKVPIGLVEIAVSGTPQTAWAAHETLDEVAGGAPNRFSYDETFQNSEKMLVKANGDIKSWQEFADKDAAARAAATPGLRSGSLPILSYPTVLYNALVHPLAPMAVRGFIWNQGEAGPTIDYGKRMVAMVTQWRKLYEQDFYFIWSSLGRNTNSGPPLVPTVQSFYRLDTSFEILKGQNLFGPNGNSALCNFYDLGDGGLHWGRRDEAGRRMAMAAMTGVYGIPKEFTGPQIIESSINGSEIRCKFSHVGAGLKYEPTIDGISGFVMLGTINGKPGYAWVTPKIDGTDSLVFSDPTVSTPTSLFYGWYANPHETLFNSDGLVASSFRVGEGNFPRVDNPAGLAELVNSTEPKIVLNISNVRRYEYVFSVVFLRGTGPAQTVKAYLPKEWEKPAVSQDGKDLPLGDITTDPAGNRFITLQVETNAAAPVVIYDSAKPDALSSADTNRY